MERLQRVATFWNWLPGFRAVAETEHLPTAAQALHVTPAALSRTVKLLEAELGHELFTRRGRRLVLNDRGHAFVVAVRDAMRRVHDAVERIDDRRLKGTLKVAAGGVGQVFAQRALATALERYPALRTQLLTPRPGTAATDLRRGTLDLVIASFVLRVEGIETELLGYDSNGVYCGPGHPLYARESLTLDAVLEHAFAAPPPDATGQTPEGWPVEVPRRVAMVIDRINVGMAVCAQGDLLAVLPDALAGQDPRLQRLPVELVPPTPVVAMMRTPLGNDDAVTLVVDLVREAFRDGVSGSSHPGSGP